MTNNGESVVGPPVFVPQRHPELTQLGRRTIHTFLQERERYVRRVSDARSQGSTFEPVALVASVDIDLLQSLIDLDTFQDVTDVKELSDECLLQWLTEQDQGTLESFTLEQLEIIVKKTLRMRVTEPDPKLRVLALFTDYKTLLRQRKIEDLIEANPKVAVRHICSVLRPPTLRRRIENDLALHKANLKKDWKGFFRHVISKAVACDEFVSAHEKFDDSSHRVSRHEQRSTDSSSRDKIHVRIPTVSQMTRGAPVASTGGTSSKATADPVPLCLNKSKCGGRRHLMKHCDKSSESEKRELLREHWKGLRTHNINRVRFPIPADSESVDTFPTLRPDGRIEGKLADQVNVVISGDYGCDHAALCDEHLQMLAAANIFVPILPLQETITMNLAVQGSDVAFTVTAKRKARVSTTLVTLEGPLRLRNVEYLVLEERMPEVLLSRPILVSLGFDLDAHLARVRSQFDDVDLSGVGFEPRTTPQPQGSTGRLARVVLRLDQLQDEPRFVDDSDDGSLPSSKENQEQSTESATFAEDRSWDNSPMEIGHHSSTDVVPYLHQMLQQSINNGLPGKLHDRMRAMLFDYEDIFRLKLGSDLPVKIPPMNIRLQPGAEPVRVKLRRYAPPQADFLKRKVAELEALGLVRRNPESAWACAPLIVPKKGPEAYRFTTDLRPVNKVTLPHAWPMPDLESVLGQLAGKQCFATVDLCQGYWQLPLAEASQECQSFITPQGVYTPTRVMHGQRNAVSFCQSSVQRICRPIIDSLLLWLDDLLFFATHAEGLLQVLEQFFDICRQFNLKLHASKCNFFLKDVRWCGRIITGSGVKLDPTRLQALLEMPPPTMGDHLQQFVCAANWMRSSMPQFTTIVAPLAELLEQVYQKAGRRTKKSVSRIKLDVVGWDCTHLAAFNAVKTALAQAVTLAHPCPNKVSCLFTDASERHWSGILSQIPQEDVDKPFQEQRHEPLAFLSGSFKGASSRWSTAEKEASAIVNSVERLDYLLLRPSGFQLFTDHSNLVFIYNPEKSGLRLNKAVYNKVQRWGILLSHFDYTIVHIAGDDNCWADLLSRWGASNQDSLATREFERKHVRLAALFKGPIAPEYDPDFVWPTAADISSAQTTISSEERAEHNLQEADGIFKLRNDSIYIPADAHHLQLRICVVGHCGRGGHRGSESTVSAIKEYCYWMTMDDDVAAFCASCLHCASTIGGLRVPRPMGHALHADKPNELIHFDFLFMGESVSGEAYVLIIKDDASSYTWLQASIDADSSSAVSAVLKWFSCFGVVSTWISDRGSHFKNKLMHAVNRALHAHHHFTAPNTPQANGTVERVCREVLRCCRALLSEFRLQEKEWPLVLPIVQSVLNHTQRAGLENHAPITLFTGLPADNPLRLIVPPSASVPKALDEIRTLRKMHVDNLLHSLQDMHKKVSWRRSATREAAVQRHNAKTHVQPVNFSVGDYVLVAKRVGKDGHKLQVQWRGPQRVIRAESDLVFECQDLLSERCALVHANRLKFYMDSQLNVTQQLLDTIQHNDPHYNVVTKLLDLRYQPSSKLYEVQAKWRGFDEEDPTWEPLAVMNEDIPDMLSRFLDEFPNQTKAERARRSLTRTRKGEV